MQTFDQALFDAVKAGTVTMDDAMQHATHPHDFKLLMATDGRRGTTMDDVVDLDDRREPEKEPRARAGASRGLGVRVRLPPPGRSRDLTPRARAARAAPSAFASSSGPRRP